MYYYYTNQIFKGNISIIITLKIFILSQKKIVQIQ